MPLFLLTWLKGFSLRQYAEAGAVVAIFLFVLWWDHAEIQKGRDECQAAIIVETNRAATQLDALRNATNPLVLKQHELEQAIANANKPPIPTNPDCAPIDADSVRSALGAHAKPTAQMR